MKCCSISALAVLFASLCVFARTSAAPFQSNGVFGLSSRGGALFGGKNKDKEAAENADKPTMYPALTQDEIEEWMSHIPVFAVTDSKGNGVVLKPDNETSVFYFFMSPQMANATLNQLKGSNPEMDLRISAFSLGKIWFKILNRPEGEEETAADKAVGPVEYRLVPDTRDILGARMLLTMDPEEGEKLRQGGSMTPEMAQKAVEKAMNESPKFKSTFNEIPVFMIAQMRMQRQVKEGEASSSENLLPMYFSLQNMVQTWQQFAAQAGPEAQGVEPAINLLDLKELVSKLKEESEIDFRNVLLIPAVPVSPGGDVEEAAAAAAAKSADPMASSGPTLGDL